MDVEERVAWLERRMHWLNWRLGALLLIGAVVLLIYGVARFTPARQEIRHAEQLNTEELKSILSGIGVHVHTFQYSGGPVRCWVEIEEKGQQTMSSGWPAEPMPKKQRLSRVPREGNIVFWLVEPNSRAGRRGDMGLKVGGELARTEFDPKALWFDWNSYTVGLKLWGFRVPKTGPVEEIPLRNTGKELILMKEEYVEELEDPKTVEPRTVTLTLKAKFP